MPKRLLLQAELFCYLLLAKAPMFYVYVVQISTLGQIPKTMGHDLFV